MASINLIVAVARNGVIGKGGKIPWHLSKDLKRFKELTTGNVIVMGRKTYESIGKALPDRINIVISGDLTCRADGCFICDSCSLALERAKELAEASGREKVFVIGGESVYRAALPFADALYLTRVEAEPDGDVFFPEIDPFEWDFQSSEPERDEKSGLEYRFEIYARKREKE